MHTVYFRHNNHLTIEKACKGASPIRSGVLLLGASLVGAPAGILVGATVAKMNRYRPQIWIAWALLIIACGLFTRLQATTSSGSAVGFEVIIAIGLGGLSTTTYFPVLAPLPLNANAPALAFFTFLRSFGQVSFDSHFECCLLHTADADTDLGGHDWRHRASK